MSLEHYDPIPLPKILDIASTDWGISSEFLALTTASTTNWPAANLAIYVPVHVPRQVVVTHLRWLNGSAVANDVDVGIFKEDGTKIVSSGATALSGVNSVQEANITDTGLARGTYYLGVSCSTTGRVAGFTGDNLGFVIGSGVVQEASAHPLPATATFAAASSNYIPQIAMVLA